MALTTSSRFILVTLILVPLPLLAQYGAIEGQVTDSSSASVSEAIITVTNVATGVSKQTHTNNSGQYTVPFLAPGRYNAEATKTGFTPLRRENFSLDVDQKQRIDFSLQVGAVATTVARASHDDLYGRLQTLARDDRTP